MPDHMTPRTPSPEAPVWLIGAGPMAVAYAAVLQALSVPFEVIGRGERSAQSFREATGVEVRTGGLSAWVSRGLDAPRAAIVAVGVDRLAEVVHSLIGCGVPNVLVEKPGGLDEREIATVAEAARASGVRVHVGYNRRFYASTRAAREIIEEDGGVSSFSFEFTEWSHVIADSPQPEAVKRAWLLANSSHVIDLAFHLGGWPDEMVCFKKGTLDWHPDGAAFTGAGSSGEALFSYSADWAAPGRWGVEILTPKRRLILRPMEQLQVQKIGSVAIEPVDIDGELDARFKPGIYRQTEAFLSGDHGDLVPLARQLEHVRDYHTKILHGGGAHG